MEMKKRAIDEVAGLRKSFVKASNERSLVRWPAVSEVYELPKEFGPVMSVPGPIPKDQYMPR